MLAFFRRQNGRAFFPPLPIAALLRRSWRWAGSNGVAWDALARLGWLRSAKGRQSFKTILAFCASREACRRAAVTSQPSCFPTSTPAPEGRGVGSRDTAPCASRETFRRAAVCISQLAGNHTRPASRETFRRAAVKPRPTRMSLYAPARLRRAVRGKGRREEARAQWAQPP